MLRAWRRGLVVALVMAGLLPALVVLALRWVNPPTSMFMVLARDQTEAPADIQYRWRPLAAIAPALSLAVVAAEDQTFPTHNGFVWEAIGKALTEHAEGRRLRGASSISQQVAKNLFLWPGRHFVRKGVEAYLTVWLEVLWPKHRILEVYLNIAQFGERVFGAEAAARHFFGVSAAALTDTQAVALASVLPAPTRYSVTADTTYLQRRRAWIARQMRLLGPGYLDELTGRAR